MDIFWNISEIFLVHHCAIKRDLYNFLDDEHGSRDEKWPKVRLQRSLDSPSGSNFQKLFQLGLGGSFLVYRISRWPPVNIPDGVAFSLSWRELEDAKNWRAAAVMLARLLSLVVAHLKKRLFHLLLLFWNGKLFSLID